MTHEWHTTYFDNKTKFVPGAHNFLFIDDLTQKKGWSAITNKMISNQFMLLNEVILAHVHCTVINTSRLQLKAL